MAFEMLCKYDFTPVSPERIEHFESNLSMREPSSLTNERTEIRKTQVARYLFRAFTSASGGGQHCAINNERKIVPHELMHNKKLDFYSRSEAELHNLALAHLEGHNYSLTLCTSWAASLFSVLCYATYLAQEHETWIGVIDTHLLEDVLVFNAKNLVGFAELEYQAYGRISGASYKAIKLGDVVDEGLCELFPKLQDWKPPLTSSRLPLEAFVGHLLVKIFTISGLVPATDEDLKVA